METRFVLPASFATALHLFALFGSGPGAPPPARPKPPPEPVLPAVPLVLVVQELSAESYPEATDTPRRGNPDVPRPTLAERPPVPTLFPPFAEPGPATVAVLDRIPAGPLGIPEGVEEGTLRSAVLSVRQLDAIPRARARVAPVYPASARTAGLSGDVLVDFVVDETGHVSAPRVVESSHPEFEEPALRAVAKWVFEPGKKNGRPVRFRMQVPVTFRLAD